MKNFKVSRERVNVIYPPLPDLPYIRREGYSSKITFTYIGRFEAHKGILNLLRAFRIALERNKAIELVLCGEGVMKKWIRDYIFNNNLVKYVKLIGKVDYRDLYKIYQRIDVVVVPSLWPEPFGRGG
jgi:glycosyltransferase involved in cell wall biosynthesis